jgi:hypothetical protein
MQCGSSCKIKQRFRYPQVAGLSRSGPALSDIQIRDKVKEVRRIDKEDTRRTEGGLITVEVGQRYREIASLFSVANTKLEF